MPDIDCTDVHRSYGSVTALDGVSLSVPAGQTLGLVGTNGAGKTTLFKLLVGHDTPDEGRVRVGGRDPAASPAVRDRVGYLPEASGFPPNRTGREVLRFHARMRGVPDRERRVARVLETVGLADAADRAVSGYSNGMHRRLGLGTTLVGDPAVLLLDEPTAGLDPHGVEAFHDVVERIAAETDITLVLTSHVLTEVERLCDRVALLEGGRLVEVASVGALRERVDDAVTVDARLVDPGEADALSAFAAGTDAVRSVRRTGDARFELACDRDAAAALVADLDERVQLRGFEVDEPGLAEAFTHILGDPAADTAGGDDATGGDPGGSEPVADSKLAADDSAAAECNGSAAADLDDATDGVAIDGEPAERDGAVAADGGEDG